MIQWDSILGLCWAFSLFPVLLLQAHPEKERLTTLGKEVSLQFTTGAVHSITLLLNHREMGAPLLQVPTKDGVLPPSLGDGTTALT